MSIEMLELYKEYLELIIEKKKKGKKLDIVEKLFIETIEDFDEWFTRKGIEYYK